jgi:hypothetical protein
LLASTLLAFAPFLGRATPDARERIPTIATASPTQIIKPREASSPKPCRYDRVAAPIRDCSVQLTFILDSSEIPQGPCHILVDALGLLVAMTKDGSYEWSGGDNVRSNHWSDLDRRTRLCLAGKEPPTEQGLRILGANLRDDDRPYRNPPYAQPDRAWIRLFKHPLRSSGCGRSFQSQKRWSGQRPN